MRLFYSYRVLRVASISVKPILKKLEMNNLKCSAFQQNFSIYRKSLSTSCLHQFRMSPDGTSSDNDYEAEDNIDLQIQQPTYSRDLLYRNSRDPLINRIYNCVSVQDLFTLFNRYSNNYKFQHLTQTILVLSDLKQICQDISLSKGENPEKSLNDFIQQLNSREEYQRILKSIEAQAGTFDVNSLSYCVLHLKKLEMPLHSHLIQLLSGQIERCLANSFSVGPASRFLETIFNDAGLQPYFLSQRIVPHLFNEIDKCNTLRNFEDVTVGLNKLHKIVTTEVLKTYINRLYYFINNNLISGRDYRVILKIISFLNYPKWREKNTITISCCMMLLKGNFNYLNANELVMLYDFFFKIQEPGDVLVELQRCASKYLQTIDSITSQKIKLFSSLMYFSSPIHRNEFERTLHTYVKECNTLDQLFLLRKVMSYIKISNEEICEIYWNKIVQHMKMEKNPNFVRLIHNYMNFNIDIDNYRHRKFENEMMGILRTNVVYSESVDIYPSKLSYILGFLLVYIGDSSELNFIVNKLEHSWWQLNHFDCIRLALSIRLVNESENRYLKKGVVQRIQKILQLIIEKEMMNDHDFNKNNTLLKACLIAGDNRNNLAVNTFLQRTKFVQNISSKHIENICFCFMSTSCLIPEVIDSLTDYVVNYKNLLGFNVEKLVYLCFYHGYTPKNPDKFFDIAINIIIRDQERLGGLSLVHCAIAFSYFNKLPNSLIKSIFNTEFLDKLDAELANCYSKDKYPQRVRKNLMELNRIVCLEYPQCGVPWFHQKFVDEFYKAGYKKKLFPTRVKEYLVETIKNPDALQEDVITPYGYHIDFVIDLNELNTAGTSSNKTKLAILLTHQFAFTTFVVQLKGQYQMKKRHLEMLGYQVVMINFSDWIELFYAGERIDFLSKLIWPKKNVNIVVNER